MTEISKDPTYPGAALRLKALEELLVEKGLIDPAALDVLIDTYETKIGPHIGAEVVARAWIDDAFRERLLAYGSKAIAEMGFGGMQGEDLLFLPNEPGVHNMIVCTLCSCYPWAVLGLPPNWYKSAPYRSRAVSDPRGVLAEFGVEPASRCRGARLGFDRGAALRRAAGKAERHGWLVGRSTRHLDHTRFARRDRARPPAGCETMNGLHDVGGMHGFGPIRRDDDEPLFHEPWERRTFALLIAVIASGSLNMDEARDGVERMDPLLYLRTVYGDDSYYWRWLCATEILLERKGIVTRGERERKWQQIAAREPA